MRNEVDAATLAVCEDSHRLAQWSYILDTSEDENYPVVSTGELILRADGVAFQRIHLCDEVGFGPWHRALRGDPRSQLMMSSACTATQAAATALLE